MLVDFAPVLLVDKRSDALDNASSVRFGRNSAVLYREKSLDQEAEEFMARVRTDRSPSKLLPSSTR